MLQPMCEVIQQLLRVGLMGMDLLRTFLSLRTFPLLVTSLAGKRGSPLARAG
jgi:hypothetical protein